LLLDSFYNGSESYQEENDTYFAVMVPLKFLEFKEQYNGVCKATSNFGNTGKEKAIIYSSIYYHLQLNKIKNRTVLPKWTIAIT
jgi:hypothetical protein